VSIFGKKKKDEYGHIYDNGDDSGNDYSDLGEVETDGDTDEYIKLYRIDAADEYFNGAFDEDGNAVECRRCGAEPLWRNGRLTCKNCGEVMSRSEFFEYIGAEPPGADCSTCTEVYPQCKETCDKYPY
jgi:hypothetical protein